MSALASLKDGSSIWRCDFCGVETVPFKEVGPLGWGLDCYPGGPHHWCRKCIVNEGIDVGFAVDWAAAWDELA
jgi:hypothetical protein